MLTNTVHKVQVPRKSNIILFYKLNKNTVHIMVMFHLCVAFRRFWFIHHGHTSMNHSCILLNLVKLIIISGMLWNKHKRCSILEYQLVNTKFSLAHGYSWCKYFYHGFRCVQYCCTGTCGTSILPQNSITSTRLFH